MSDKISHVGRSCPRIVGNTFQCVRLNGRIQARPASAWPAPAEKSSQRRLVSPKRTALVPSNGNARRCELVAKQIIGCPGTNVRIEFRFMDRHPQVSANPCAACKHIVVLSSDR